MSTPARRIREPDNMAKRTQAPAKTEIVIMGETPLVEEYAELCASCGFTVHEHWNQRPQKEIRRRPKNRRTSPASPGAPYGIELTNTDVEQKRKNLRRLDRSIAPKAILLSSSVVVTATEQASWIRHPERLVGISALPSFLSHQLVEFSPAIQTTPASLSKAQDFFIRLGKQVSVVQDRVGMVLPRILCGIINEAYFALQENIALPRDIDVAMKLGTNYPHGPIEWAEKIGIHQVHAVLRALRDDLHEDRYRIAPLLNQMTAGGEWWRNSHGP